MSTPPLTLNTPEEYLAAERKAERKSEYLNGEVFAMSGNRWAHVQITANIQISLGIQFKGRDCTAATTELRLRVNPCGNYMYTYPDTVVVCGKPQFEDKQFDTLLNPKILIEVLSRSTERFDRGKKAELYRQIDSLTEHLFVAQDERLVQHYARQPNGDWLLSEKRDAQDVIELKSVDATLLLADIYDRVEFSAESESQKNYARFNTSEPVPDPSVAAMAGT